MKWPAQSPDLNPIENLCYQVELSLKHKGPFKNADELYKAIETTWNEITQEKINKLEHLLSIDRVYAEKMFLDPKK